MTLRKLLFPLLLFALVGSCVQPRAATTTVSPPPTRPPTPPPSTPPTYTRTPLPALAPPTGPTRHSSVPSGTETGPLASLIEAHRTILEAGATMNILPSVPPESVSIAYTSVLRPLDSETRGFLWQYGVSSGDDDFSSQFTQELLIHEGRRDFWAPFRESNVTPLLGHLVALQVVTAEVRLLGSLQTEEGLRVVFAITDIAP